MSSSAFAICCLRTQVLTSTTLRTARRSFISSRRRQAPRPAPAGGGLPAVRAMSAAAEGGDFTAMVKAKNSENPVMVYSKTYCPYCTEVKSIFERMGVAAKVIELDDLADGDQVQQAIQTITGRRTVPQVFIGGEHLGGCDDTIEAKDSGKLKTLLEQAGVQANQA